MATLNNKTEDGIKIFGLSPKRIPRDIKLVWLVFKKPVYWSLKKLKSPFIANFCLIAATEKFQMLCNIQIIEKWQIIGQVIQYEPWHCFPESTPYKTMHTFRFPIQLTWRGDQRCFLLWYDLILMCALAWERCIPKNMLENNKAGISVL